MLPDLTLVLGGANSGKSALAEELCLKSGLSPVYIATAQAFDAEMTQKISDHRARRGAEWRTEEAPIDPVSALSGVKSGEVVLLDCVTIWLSNLLLAEHDLDAACTKLIASLGHLPCPAVVVSNEVGQGIVPETQLGRQIRAAQGKANQRLAAEADRVIAVMAGLPLVLKGAPQ